MRIAQGEAQKTIKFKGKLSERVQLKPACFQEQPTTSGDPSATPRDPRAGTGEKDGRAFRKGNGRLWRGKD